MPMIHLLFLLLFYITVLADLRTALQALRQHFIDRQVNILDEVYKQQKMSEKDENKVGNHKSKGFTHEKPKMLILFLISVGLELAIGIALVVIMIVMGYVGFQQSTDKVTLSGFCSFYLQTKYKTNINFSISISFVQTILGLVACVASFIIILKLLIGKPREITSSQNTSILREKAVFYQIVPPKYARALYILQSISCLVQACALGYYLSFNIQLSKCQSFAYTQNQILIIAVFLGIGFGFCLVSWVIISLVVAKVNEEYFNLKKEYLYLCNQMTQHKTEQQETKNQLLPVEKKNEQKVEQFSPETRQKTQQTAIQTSIFREHPIEEVKHQYPPHQEIQYEKQKESQPYYQKPPIGQKKKAGARDRTIFQRQHRFNKMETIVEQNELSKITTEKGKNSDIVFEGKNHTMHQAHMTESGRLNQNNKSHRKRGIFHKYLYEKYND